MQAYQFGPSAGRIWEFVGLVVGYRSLGSQLTLTVGRLRVHETLTRADGSRNSRASEPAFLYLTDKTIECQ